MSCMPSLFRDGRSSFLDVDVCALGILGLDQVGAGVETELSGCVTVHV